MVPYGLGADSCRSYPWQPFNHSVASARYRLETYNAQWDESSYKLSSISFYEHSLHCTCFVVSELVYIPMSTRAGGPRIGYTAVTRYKATYAACDAHTRSYYHTGFPLIPTEDVLAPLYNSIHFNHTNTIEPMTVQASKTTEDIPQSEAPERELLVHLKNVQKCIALAFIDSEVELLCGTRYEHDSIQEGCYYRWGSNPGSITIGLDRVKIRVPRIRDQNTKKERPLQTYKALRLPTEEQKKKLTKRVILEPNNHLMKEAGIKALREFEEKDLSEDTYVILMLDGTSSQGRSMMACAGITKGGKKCILGFIEISTENATVVAGLLENLVERGLRYDQGILFVMDGSKGIQKGVQRTFGKYAHIQRCTWHKRENVARKITRKKIQETVRKQLNDAYNKDTYEKTKQALLAICDYLTSEGQHRAANSLKEGMEESLTFLRLGVGKELGRSIRTANMMENINSRVKATLRKVTHWEDSTQFRQWIAMALKEAEPGLKKFDGTDQLEALQGTLLEQVQKHSPVAGFDWS